MSLINEKEGLSVSVTPITKPTATRQYFGRDDVLSTIEDVDSEASLSRVTTREDKERDTSPFSPFYSPAPTRTSIDAMKTESKANCNVYQTDLESGLLDSSTKCHKPCTVWPGRQQLKQQRKLSKRSAGCNPLARCSKKTANIIKVLIGLLLVGLIIGVGLGVTKAVGGGIWHSNANPNAAATV